MPHSGSSAVSISVIRLLVLESGCFADQAASAVAPDEIIRPQRRAVVQLHVDDGVVLREARHLTSAIDRHRQLADPTGQYALDAVLPQPEPVVVQRGKVADVQGDPGEPRDLRHLPPREEPIVERRASISPVGPPPATTTACPVIAAPWPASRRPPPARRAPATAPRPPTIGSTFPCDPYVDDNTRISPLPSPWVPASAGIMRHDRGLEASPRCAVYWKWKEEASQPNGARLIRAGAYCSPGPSLLSLFTRVRGREILRTSPLRSSKKFASED